MNGDVVSFSNKNGDGVTISNKNGDGVTLSNKNGDGVTLNNKNGDGETLTLSRAGSIWSSGVDGEGGSAREQYLQIYYMYGNEIFTG